MRRYSVATASVGLILLAGCASGTTSSPTQLPTPPTASATTATRAYRIGESFVLPASNNSGTFRLTVDGVSGTVTSAAVQAYANEYGSQQGPLVTQPDPGHKWVVVAVHGTNAGNQPAFLLTQFFVLTAGGKQFDASLSDTKAQNVADGYNYTKNQELSTELNPEQTGYEWVVYQIPNDLPVQSVLIGADGPSNGPSVTVDLTGH